MVLQTAVRRYGVPSGAAGIEVIERSSGNALADPKFGTIALFGNLKRGPMGVAVPVYSRSGYDSIYGDPRDSRWHLYNNGAHLLPDAIDGFFTTGGGAGMVWITRLDLDGKARKAELTLKNRIGAPALKIVAANEGRWGGAKNSVALTPVVSATVRTFTLVSPGVFANEFVDASVEFTSVPGKKFQVVGNTESNAISGETVFTVGAQYDLVNDGVSGPVALNGIASYERYANLSGTIAYAQYDDLTGTVNINGLVVTGVGTQFTQEVRVGETIYHDGESRVIESLTSDTTLTISAPFTVQTATGQTAQRDNLYVVGTGTQFTNELAVGDQFYFVFDGERQSRTVAEVISVTSLKLTSGFEQAIPAISTAQRINLEVVGVGTQFLTQVQPGGNYIIDPLRAGSTVKVTAVLSNTTLEIEEAFASSFADAQLTKQAQRALVELTASPSEGLTVEVGQGQRYPDTHFSLTIRFNGSLVLQVPDASLDANDPLFVETQVNDGNIAYRTGTTNFQTWVTAESLWDSAYTTNEETDVRPCNGSGIILEMSKDRLYTVAEMAYESLVGSYLYPNPYAFARGFFRIKNAKAPVELDGTISSLGVNVTGVATTFKTYLKAGDYLYDPNTKTARRIRSVPTDTLLVLDTVFPINVPPTTVAMKAGYLDVDQAYDLNSLAAVGDRFLVSYQENLTRGYDGNTSNIIPYFFTKYADVDINHIENATFGRNLGLIRIACPGISDISIQKAFAFYASAKAYEFRGEIPSSYNTAAAAESFINHGIGRNDFQTLSFPSYGYISNPLSAAGDRLVPLSGDVMGGESRLSGANEGYHFPFAGIQAILPRIVKLPFEAKPNDEAIVNVAGIQTIKTMNGNVVVFGGRAPSLSSAYDFIHIRRIQSNYVRVFLEAKSLLELLFLPNQPGLSDQILLVLNNFARREYQKGVMTNYLSFRQAVQIQNGIGNNNTITDESTEDALVRIINGRLDIFMRYVPTGILEKLAIHCGPDILVAQFGDTIGSEAL